MVGMPILGCVLSGLPVGSTPYVLPSLVIRDPFLTTEAGQSQKSQAWNTIKLFCRDQGTRRCDSLPDQIAVMQYVPLDPIGAVVDRGAVM